MSKIGCLCGHVIVDQTNNLRYKGRVLRDQDEESLVNLLTESVQSLFDAEKAGQTEAWIDRNFASFYPRDLSASSMIHDLFVLAAIADYLTGIYECEACGRLLVQRGPGENYHCFIPESGSYDAILKSKRRAETNESGPASANE